MWGFYSITIYSVHRISIVGVDEKSVII